jgi:hypothetical protein
MLSDGADRYDVAEPNTCVVAGSGNDVITGCKMSGSFVLGGSGDDVLTLGQGVVAYGGPGNDTIESLGNAALFGNDGDDTIISHAGTNVIFPGSGKDRVETGSGNDTVVLFDECEVTAGKIIDLGEGHDVVIAPLPRAELEARGVVLRGVEEVRVESNPCKSDCRTPPQCVGGGQCTVQAGGALACACPPWSEGPTCATPRPLAYASPPAPTLDGADDPARIRQARAFISWFANGTAGDRDAVKGAIDATRGNLSIRDALLSVGRDLLASPLAEEQHAAVEVIGYMNCRRCVDVLIEFFPPNVPDGPVIESADPKTRPRAVQSLMAWNLAKMGTRRTKAFLLEHLARHSDAGVRQSIVFALAQAYGEAIRSQVASVARPEDMFAFDWIDNADPNYDAKFRARHPR